MKKKKLLLSFLIIMVFLTGCTTKYELIIDDSMLNEKIEIEEDSNTLLQKAKEEYPDYNDYHSDTVVTIYEMEFKESLVNRFNMDADRFSDFPIDIKGTRSSSIYTVNNDLTNADSFKVNSIASYMFHNFNVSVMNKVLTVSASNIKTDIFSLVDNINIVVKTNYELVDSNCTNSRQGNEYAEYTWNINSTNDEIYIKLKNDQFVSYNPEVIKEEAQDTKKTVLILSIAILTVLLLSLIIYYINKERKKSFR